MRKESQAGPEGPRGARLKGHCGLLQVTVRKVCPASLHRGSGQDLCEALYDGTAMDAASWSAPPPPGACSGFGLPLNLTPAHPPRGAWCTGLSERSLTLETTGRRPGNTPPTLPPPVPCSGPLPGLTRRRKHLINSKQSRWEQRGVLRVKRERYGLPSRDLMGELTEALLEKRAALPAALS